jgi:hypothetical protein
MSLDRYEYVQFEIIVPEKGDIEIVYIKAAKSCTSSCDARSKTTRCLLQEQIDPTFAMQAIRECKVGYL